MAAHVGAGFEDVDLADHDSFRDATPYEWFARLRREAPVWRHPAPADGTLPPFWCLTRYEDIAAVSHDHRRFSSRYGASLLQLQSFDEELLSTMPEFLIQMDPPAHTRMRKIISGEFTPRRMARLEPRVAELAHVAVEAGLEDPDGDFLAIAAALPIEVIAEMMGVPNEDRPKLYDWTTRTFGVEDPECSIGHDDFLAAFAETFEYALALCRDKRRRPRDDLLSLLAAAEVDGLGLSDIQLATFFYLLSTAGNETTRTLLMQGMNVLLEHPEVDAELRAEPRLLPTAVEEMLRFCSPVHHMLRTAMEDVELRGQRLIAGDRVVMWYVSGNRDEKVFEDPDRFELHRQRDPGHQAFGGGGIHHCLGSHLARLEARALFAELFRRTRAIESAGTPSRLRSNFTHGLKHLPVRYHRP
jgi:cholest-4-en-3-one 26-monooxygenase